MAMKTFVMIPTYNERKNVPLIVKSIMELPVENINIVIVDDNSPDGTADAVRDLMKTYNRLYLLLRQEKKGRGYAGVAGFKYCIANGADYVIEMDADLSHAPEYIPEFIKKIENYDIIIGSRFKLGGSVLRHGLIRNLVTFFARNYINLFLGLNVTDPTSGYRCFKRKTLEGIDLDSIISEGPSILQETLYRIRLQRMKIGEIPIVFADRVHGQSTFNVNLAIKSFLMILKFRFSSCVRNMNDNERN